MSGSDPLKHGYNEDKTNDDTLNHIRKEYLESKKQVSDLLSQPKIQKFEQQKRFYSNSSPIRKQDSVHHQPTNGHDEMLKQQLRGASAGKATSELPQRFQEDYFIQDDMKFLRRVINEQQECIRDLKRSLEQQKFINHDLEHKISSLESRLSKMEWSYEIFGGQRNVVEPNYEQRPSNSDPSTMVWESNSINHFNKNRSNNESDRIFSNYDDSTTRLMQITDPRYKKR
ncbi:hypothetical protein RNJ44_04138 [Nakaseomyces bracarensis]|uniref:Spindle pole component 29 n=1 Tax=Nakaseomyces bracarensis TaxID=273131 RepID=A0ABR4NU14_9SACH